MESPTQKFSRLLTALDELVAEESALITAADYPAIDGVQQRAGEVLAALSALPPESASEQARRRVGILLERREQNIQSLQSKLAAARQELDALQSSARRAARVAPVYGQSGRRSEPQQLHKSG